MSSPPVGLGATQWSTPRPLPSHWQAWSPEIPQMMDLSRSSSPTFHFSDGEASQRGKGTCPRAPSRSLGTLELAPGPTASVLCHLTHALATPPSPLRLLQFLAFSPHPASSSAQACLLPHLSPHLLSHCCLCFLLPAPEARGGSPPSLWPLLSLLVLPSLSWGSSWGGLPLLFHFLLTP